MQILKNDSIQTNSNNTTFQRVNRLPIHTKRHLVKDVSDATYQAMSAAIAAAGIAGITTDFSYDDYLKSISVPVKRLHLNDEDMKAIERGYEIAPALMDIYLSHTTDKNMSRTVNKSSIEKLLESYELNPLLTEELFLAKNEKGNFKYPIDQIRNIVYINEECPELLEIAKSNGTLVRRLLETTDYNGNLSFGIEDIVTYNELFKTDKKFTRMILSQRNLESGSQRFSSKEAKELYENYDDFMHYLINAIPARDISYKKESFRFTFDELIQLHDMCVTDEEKEQAKTIIETKFSKIDYPPNKFPTHLKGETVLDIIAFTPYEIVEKYAKEYSNTELIKMLKIKNEEISTMDLEKMLHVKRGGHFPAYALNIKDLKEISPENYIDAIIEYTGCDFTEEERETIIEHINTNPDLAIKVIDYLSTTGGVEELGFSKENAFSILEEGKKNPKLMMAVFDTVYDSSFRWQSNITRPLEGERPERLFKTTSWQLESFIKKQLNNYTSFTEKTLLIFEKLINSSVARNYYPN